MTDAGLPELGAWVQEAFPAPLHPVLPSVVGLLARSDLDRNTALLRFCTVRVGRHILRIPDRIYSAEPSALALASLTGEQRTAISCWFTRHHDGYIRQRHLEAVIESEEAWVVPYVLRLVGEYVVEILEVIDTRLRDLLDRSSLLRQRYADFVEANPAFIDLTRQRVVSYWNCYYRNRWPRALRLNPNYTDYPGFRLMELIRDLGGIDG
jgi:hypothetical protein